MVKQSDGRRWGRLKKYGISAEENKRRVEAGFLWCCFCKQFLTSDKFTGSQVAKRFGVRCIECDRAQSIKYYREHIELRREKNKRSYAKNAEKYRRYARDHWASFSKEEQYEIRRRHTLKGRFGLSAQGYDALLEKQGGGCAICGKQPNGSERLFPIDHDHACCLGRKSCGKCIRGILCMQCNMLIGLLEKNKDLIPKCEAYLAQSPADTPRA